MESPASSQPASMPQSKGKSKRKKDLRISCMSKPPAPNPTPPRNLDSRTFITIGDRNFEVEADDLVTISELGRGAYGVVEKVRHAQSGTIMAVKRIRATVNSQEQKRLLMDLDINMRTVDCFYTVTFYGALFREGDVWICMELMDTSLDKFYRKVLEKGMTIPEDILGEIAVSIVRALEHLHSKLSVIHRDVKPSNVLINKEGHVKMCDFGISGYLVDSVAKTMDAGCKPYMAPERINPELNQKGYNVKSDVWSLGITMPEEEPRRADELPGADGAPLLHFAQNQEDGHCCLREGDPGRRLIGPGPWTPLWPSRAPRPHLQGQCSPAP
ncbi:dual specificity mitogen-activated protein kinase kinase 3 isoform X2 [Cebus imitator]|uniref:mitogen-activated protein kinase kinase n=1 Tax=Sapajus apella TaxID=9515 RepID=A0A6J3GMV5_SAPAP|nr:dual specificity mitogen-activated protein kinase kinase 3 isoform X2 [Cebus imitator]XP_032119433.1 dual specificity mitogen-activated protein kinase kinase 3 isoform X2 [Sapajus apella]